MDIDITLAMIVLTAILFLVFLLLLFLWILRPERSTQTIRKNPKEELKKIKEQINGDE